MGKMKAADVKDGATLTGLLGQHDEALDAVDVKLADEVKQRAEGQKKIEDVEAKNAALIKEMESLRFMVKDKWKDTEPPKAKAYGIGRMVKAMMDRDLKTLGDMGCQPNREVATEEWKGEKDWDFKSNLGTALTGAATTGSYLIPVEYASEVLRIAADNSAMMSLVRNLPMRARQILWPSEATGLTFSWPTTEGTTAKTEKSPTFGQITLNAKTAAGWITITEELNEDSLVPIGEYFRDVFGEAWGTEFDKQCLAANAAPFDGVLFQTSVNEQVMAKGKTGFQDAEPDDIRDLIAKLTTKGKRNGARLIMHETVLDVLLSWKNAIGGYELFRPAEGKPQTIFGYPYTTSDAMPDISDSAVSTAFIIFGNPKHILHGDRIGFEFRVFDNTEATMQYDRIFLRARLRQGFEVGIPAAFARLVTAAS